MNLPNGPDGITSSERLEITELFRSLASKVAHKDFGEEVTETSVISELGLDSIHNLEIIGEMERELAIQVPNEDLEDINTVGELLDVVQRAWKPQR
ncbi:MAG: acyl carrier protein, partial [Polyangiales bacterium]